MKVVHVSFTYDEKIKTEEELLEKHYTVTGWAEALQRKGTEVIVINRFFRDSSLQKNGVNYAFVKDNLGPGLKSWQLPLKFFRKIKKLNADIVHLHNLFLSLQTFVLRIMLGRKTAIVVQHHGGVLPGRKKRWLHNLFNNAANGFFFTTSEQGREWFINKKAADKVMPVMEGATFFNFDQRDAFVDLVYHDRAIERARTGISGSPVFLWVGRLDDNKDPLTVLDGFEILFEKHPAARLYMIYNDDRLAGRVKEKIDSAAVLKSRVRLVGEVEHNKIEQFYNSADYFVLGSHYEGSGYALSEGLRCGCVPIVTDIPSFRMMTNEGNLGALWETGGKNSFVEAAIKAISKPLVTEANACIDFFKDRLSFEAIAGISLKHYQKLIKKR
ncbi:MAG: glycosyltransferase family 4 protein [Bacteroidetes bacterium]|nr:MAG: glycosyltransferase family 4 protein [Bacteroidota bacterium]